MQKFNSINVESRFIKSILKNTYLPIHPSVRNGDYIVSGVTYNYKNSLIKCTQSGVLALNKTKYNSLTYVPRKDANGNIIKGETSVACSDMAICSGRFMCGSGIRMAKTVNVTPYKKNTFVPGITSGFESANDKYDVLTHRRLGDYLRWVRDANDIDLMSLYNCFDGETTNLVHVKDLTVQDGSIDGYTSWIVKAQPNKTYTIFIESPNRVDIQGVFLNKFGRITSLDENDKPVCIDSFMTSPGLSKTASVFSRPIVYRPTTNSAELVANSQHFYILIQTDRYHSGNVVVLEGEYANYSTRYNMSVESVDGADYSAVEYSVLPSLAMSPNSPLVPYSDRLIEFLTQHAISSEEDIPLNVSRVQLALPQKDDIHLTNDVWSDQLRYKLYNNHFKYVNDYYFKSAKPTEDEIQKVAGALYDVPNSDLFDVPEAIGTVIDGHLIGDLNRDGVIDLEDLVLMQKVMNDWDLDVDLKALDFNQDFEKNGITSIDEYKRPESPYGNRQLVQLQRYISNINRPNKHNGIGVFDKDTGELIGLKNCVSRRGFTTAYDITGYVDKDIENTLFKYRSID